MMTNVAYVSSISTAADFSLVDGGTLSVGPPAVPTIPASPCPGTPQLLWTRTISTSQAYFGAIADADGNLYWIESDFPAPGSYPPGPTWLVAADREGQTRYRVAAPAFGLLMVAGGRVVVCALGPRAPVPRQCRADDRVGFSTHPAALRR